MTARWLVIVRAGDESLHERWLGQPSHRQWDLAISSFGEKAAAADQAVFVHKQAGAKWPGLVATMNAYRDTVDRYEYVWMPDDDIECDVDSVNRLFETVAEHELELAQPALTPDSHFSHTITLRHANFALRFTNLVELMVPIFSREFLQRVLPTMSDAISGWGLDGVWPQMSSLGRVAIIDNVSVRHTRPVGGPNYKHSEAGGLSPESERNRARARFGIEWGPEEAITLGGITADGRIVAVSDKYTEANAFLEALHAAILPLGIDGVQRARYIANHWNFSTRSPRPYPRQLIGAHLRQLHNHRRAASRPEREPDDSAGGID